MNPFGSRAQVFYNQGRYKEALGELTNELAITPDDAHTFAWMSLCHSQLNNAKSAVESANKAIALEPDSSFGFYALSRAELVANRVRKAEAAIRQAIEIEPYDSHNYGILAVCLARQERWKASLEAAEAGLQADPNDELCANSRAHALSLMGRSNEAVQAARDTVAENPESSQAHTMLGYTSLRKGDHKAAEGHFMEALRLDPDEDAARDGLLESLRARFPLYRWMIQFSTWQAQHSKTVQYVILFAILLVPRLIRQAAKSNPQAQPYLIPIAMCASFLIWFMWIGEQLTNVVLLTHPVGRMALERHVRFESIVIAIYLGLGVISLILGAFLGPAFLIAAGIFWAGVVLMSLCCKIEKYRWLRHLLFGGVASVAGIAGIAILAVKLLTSK